MRVQVLYFASLRDAAGCASEMLDLHPMTFAMLYDELRARYGFALEHARLRIARDGVFAQWGESVGDGDEIAFIPPVSGG